MTNLKLREKIAQMFLVGIPNKESINVVIKLIKKESIGGVILYKSNYSNLEELRDLINKLKKANQNNKLPLTISIDQEGGRVNRLPKEFVNTLSLHKMSKNDDKDIKLLSKTTSKLLKDLGINMNFAPVLDLKKHNDNHAIGNRAISSNFNRVSDVAKIICNEFDKNNIVSVVKHFPGQGSVHMDSHIFLPMIFNYRKILEDDSKPFESMIKNNVGAIMVGHMFILGRTGICPASISKRFINKELRERYNYNNIVVTDELGMRAVRYLYGKNNSVIKAFKAKNDIICCKYSPNYIEKLIDRIECLVKKEKINIEDIDMSINRIIDMKIKYNFNDNICKSNVNIEEYNKIINKLNDLASNK